MSGATILLVGGGTGGHVFPTIAVADALRSLNPDIPLLFVGTSKGLEARVVPERGYELEFVEAEPIRGRGVGGALRGIAGAFRSTSRARRLLRERDIAVVFSLGGYAAGGIALAARTLGIPVALMEPNSAIGLTNRVMAPLVRRAYTAFEESERHFSKKALLRSGVAIRSGFSPKPYAPADPLRVLVVGGSQGAQALNEAVPQALESLPRPVSVLHQAGRGKADAVEERYREFAAEHVRVVEFIDDMVSAISDADLVVGRAGASALAEICAIGRPSVLIPYPFAASDHQLKNARALERVGAAVCVPQAEASSEAIARVVAELEADRDRLSGMARSAREWGKPDAALDVARDLLLLAGLEPPVTGRGEGSFEETAAEPEHGAGLEHHSHAASAAFAGGMA